MSPATPRAGSPVAGAAVRAYPRAHRLLRGFADGDHQADITFDHGLVENAVPMDRDWRPEILRERS